MGWKQTGTAKDGRAIFDKEDNSSYTQRSRGYSQTHIYTRSVKRVSPDQIQVVSNVKGDFPVWIDLRNAPDGAVERQIIYPYPDPSTGEPLGQVVRRQWSDRSPAYKNERNTFVLNIGFAHPTPKRVSG